MERTQDLLYYLNELIEQGRVPRVPVFIDSPLAIKLTTVYSKYRKYFNEEIQKIKHAEKFFGDTVKIIFKTQYNSNRIVDLIKEIYEKFEVKQVFN